MSDVCSRLDTNVKQATSWSVFVFVLPHKSCGIIRRDPKSLDARRLDRCATCVCELRSRSADCWSQLALQACSRNLTARRWTHSCTTHWNKHGCSFISEISRRPGDSVITSLFLHGGTSGCWHAGVKDPGQARRRSCNKSGSAMVRAETSSSLTTSVSLYPSFMWILEDCISKEWRKHLKMADTDTYPKKRDYLSITGWKHIWWTSRDSERKLTWCVLARLPAPFIGSNVVLSNNNRVVSDEETRTHVHDQGSWKCRWLKTLSPSWTLPWLLLISPSSTLNQLWSVVLCWFVHSSHLLGV